MNGEDGVEILAKLFSVQQAVGSLSLSLSQRYLSPKGVMGDPGEP